MVARMRSLDVSRMPPVGSLAVDTEGSALVSDRIASLDGCD
jgi:hypothetical protein